MLGFNPNKNVKNDCVNWTISFFECSPFRWSAYDCIRFMCFSCFPKSLAKSCSAAPFTIEFEIFTIDETGLEMVFVTLNTIPPTPTAVNNVKSVTASDT